MELQPALLPHTLLLRERDLLAVLLLVALRDLLAVDLLRLAEEVRLVGVLRFGAVLRDVVFLAGMVLVGGPNALRYMCPNIFFVRSGRFVL